MSRHSAFNNYDYDNELDEYDGYDNTGEEELSPEDREQMVLGTSAVREALAAESSKVTTAQIQEALWHYYYDVDKSVAYLVSKYISPPADSKKAKKATNNPEGMSRFPSSPFLSYPSRPSSVRSGSVSNGGIQGLGMVRRLRCRP